MPVSPAEIEKQYAEAVDAAKRAYQDAQFRLNQAQEFLDAAPEPTDVTLPEGMAQGQKRREYAQRVDTLQKAYASAQQNYVDTLHQRADAINKAKADADPATTARLEAQAKADTARAAQIEAESKEYTETAPQRRETAAAEARLKKAQADEAEYGLALARETDPQKKATAQAALERAQAETARIQAETAQVGKPTPQTPEQQRAAAAAATTAEANAAVAPTVANATATTAAAAASTAQPLAETNLAKAQADAKAAQIALEDAQRRARQAPTDQQAQQAIAAAQRNADLANQQLENAIAQAGNLNPIAVEQARATLEQTRANTQKGLQGDLYGRQEQIRQIRSLVASGDIGTAEADQMVNALNRGTSVYQAQTQMQADRTSARGQDLSNKNALAGNFTSAMTSGFSTLADMNKYAKVGSTAGADAFLGLLNIAQDRLKSYELPPAQTTDYLGPTSQPSAVSGMVQAAQQQIQQPVQQPVGQTGAHQVTINIGGTTSQPVTPYQPAPTTYNNTPETSAASAERNNLAGLVSEAARRVPAGLDDINAAYGVGEPRMMARGGVVTRPTLAMIGEAGPEAVVPLDSSRYLDSAMPIRDPYRSTLAPPPIQPLPLAGADQPMIRTPQEVIDQANYLGLTGTERDLFIFGYTNPGISHQFVRTD